METLKKVDNWFERIVEAICTIMLILLVLIVFISVLTRFVIKTSTGNLADTPPYLMIWLVFLGAPFAVKRNTHIRIDLINMVIKNELALTIVDCVLCIVATLTFAWITKDSYIYLNITRGFGNAEASLHIPYWILYSGIAFDFTFMTVYYFVNTIKNIYKGVTLCRRS